MVLRETPFIYRQVKNTVIIFREGEEPDWEGEAFLLKSEKEAKTLSRITGKIRDEQGEPMAGVNVIEKGTTNGTSSDANGRYAIQVSDEAILAFSFISYQTFETEISSRTVIDVVLNEDVAILNEVTVNAGYYNVKEREYTGSIAKVSSEIIEKQPVTNPLGALQGRMSGVYIQQTTGVPGGDFKIQIRGRNSLRDDGNEPLYIVDGVPFSTEKTFSAEGSTAVFNLTSSSSGASPLAAINPSDIESIEVLKDADATAIYGSRGANGVVLITTKKGKTGKTTFDINLYTGAGKIRTVPLLNRHEYLALRREAFANDGITPSADPNDLGYAPELMIWDTTRNTDWQKVLMGGNCTNNQCAKLHIRWQRSHAVPVQPGL